jgi:copper resistance protein D
MEWPGDDVNGLMIVRAIHFSSSAILAGTLIFWAVVAEPALRSAETIAVVVRTQALRVAWTGLVVAAASGVIWVLLQAAAMSGRSFGEAMTADVLSSVVTGTQFGLVSEIRLLFAIILAGCLTYDRTALLRWLGLASALGLVATIAWTGHAGAGVGVLAIPHLTADALHLLAAAAWLGGLVSLAVLLTAARHDGSDAWAPVAQAVTERFSTLGIVSVGTILATGIVNSGILVGSLHALTATEYGRLLVLKICLFAIMVLIATVNRLWLTPQLALRSASAPPRRVLRRLARNSIIEIALGLAIFAIVAALGTMHPAIHFEG